MVHFNKLSRRLGARHALAAAALLVIMGLQTPAMADQNADMTRAKKLTLTDLDLASSTGQRAARERLRQVARDLCARAADNLDLSHQSHYLACLKTALAQADDRLTAMIARSGTGSLASN